MKRNSKEELQPVDRSRRLRDWSAGEKTRTPPDAPFKLLSSCATSDLFVLICGCFVSTDPRWWNYLYKPALHWDAGSLVCLASVSKNLNGRVRKLPAWEGVKEALISKGLITRQAEHPKPDGSNPTPFDRVCRYYAQRYECRLEAERQKREEERKARARERRLRCGHCEEAEGRPYPHKGLVRRNRLCRDCWGRPQFNVVNKGQAKDMGFSKRIVDACDAYKHNGSHWIYVRDLEKERDKWELLAARARKQRGLER